MTTVHSILQSHVDHKSFQSSRARGDPLFGYIARCVACVKQNGKRRSPPQLLSDVECYNQARVRLLAQPDVSHPPSAASSSSPSSPASNSDLLLDVYAHTSTLVRVLHPPPPSSAVADTSPAQREEALRRVLNDCRTVRAAQVRRGEDLLAPSKWLDDNIISFGVDALNLEYGFPSNRPPSTHAFCFTSLEVSSGKPLGLSQTHTRYPWTARAHELPHRWWLLPLHVHGNHWGVGRVRQATADPYSHGLAEQSTSDAGGNGRQSEASPEAAGPHRADPSYRQATRRSTVRRLFVRSVCARVYAHDLLDAQLRL